MESFKRLQIVAENPENRQAARLGIMRCALQTGQQKDALLAADELLKEPKLSPELEAEARYVRAKAYIAQKQANKALADLKELSKDTRTVHGAEAKYLLAQLYYDTNDDKNAEKVLMNFIENGTPHQYWLARGFILLADIYIRQGDDFQARQYLTSLQNNYKGDDDIAGMIENRLEVNLRTKKSDEDNIQHQSTVCDGPVRECRNRQRTGRQNEGKNLNREMTANANTTRPYRMPAK